MAKMIPPTIDPDVKSDAERKIFRWFEKLEWKNCVVLHSLGIAQHNDNVFGEIDFVIISTEGIICVEVKGGQVFRKEGRWFYRNRFGQEDSKNKGPFEQAQGNMHSLRSHMLKRLNGNDPLVRCQYSCCVITPDCSIVDNAVDVIPEVLFDTYKSVDELGAFLEKSVQYWKNQCMSKHGFEGGKLSVLDIERAVNLLRGDFKFIPSLSVIMKRTDEQLLAVTEEQYSIMEGFEDNERLLISGAAGTGKTLLAMEQCRRYSAAGKKVLFLCYNKLIALYVSECRNVQKDKFDVYNIHRLLRELCDSSVPEDVATSYFEKELPEEFIDKVDNGMIDKKYDVVVIDEGQDLMNTYYYMCINYLIKGGFSKGIWSVYFDPSQNLFNNYLELNDIWNQLKSDADTNYKLSINCRNTRQIAVANKMISNVPQAKQLKAEGVEVEYIEYSNLQEEAKLLIKTIRSLRSQGISASDIVILSPYIEKSCVNEINFPNDIGPIRINPKDNLSPRTGTDFYTIQAFKGLESKVVLLIDIDDFESESGRLLNYVAVSRARTILYVFFATDATEQRQKMLLQGALMD